jgi:hypothetical protein
LHIIHTVFLSQKRYYRFSQNQIIINLTKLKEKNITIYDIKEIYYETILHDKLNDILSPFQIISRYDLSICIYVNFAMYLIYAMGKSIIDFPFEMKGARVTRLVF